MSSDFWVDPLRSKCFMYWHLNRRNFENWLKIHLLVPFWTKKGQQLDFRPISKISSILMSVHRTLWSEGVHSEIWRPTPVLPTPSYCHEIFNIGLFELNWTPNDRKLDAGSEYGVRFPRKTIFSLNTRFKKVEYLVLLGVGGNRQFFGAIFRNMWCYVF